ncbi:PTS sugar transporter subunit IIA [Marinitenerispora sediminis]|uniref:Ascorbate-specific PTS system EIIA component n=1 Tax=Marinitenerispora sediminis TaxID=1931232 RepID=A0A368T8N6_9ACTN|nr:PTS sugar transporter subunit IIA [Marinitenerispora sediminis]RCV53523.1 PTS sugar transporter subunit IIAB [Marinitenerispora sediminis]RCV57680.1 PTS sugar transporter subunit IIAB [Marinitenerispora sediminis]RCV60764.1 PTS sugar transporter subunit IIAB [Marinitenerispora sediminis]
MAEPAITRLLAVEAIVTGIQVDDWRAAIRAAGELLVAAGATTDAYTEQMRAAVEQHGPYIVIAPGIALAHARPSHVVLRTALSWAGLATPVEFGHPDNDPVELVVGLAAVDHDGHSAVLARISHLLAERDLLRVLRAASGPEEIRALLAKHDEADR